MLSLNPLARRFLALLAVCGVVAITSCGTEDGFGKRYAVSGTVTYNGSPLEKGTISFVPDDPKSVGASGVIENGSYTLSTAGEKDGARAGKYKVTISSKEDASAKAKADFEKVAKGAKPRPRPWTIRGQGGGRGQEPDPRRIRRRDHDDPHGRGQGTTQHASTSSSPTPKRLRSQSRRARAQSANDDGLASSTAHGSDLACNR